jgi:hypothetical protein
MQDVKCVMMAMTGDAYDFILSRLKRLGYASIEDFLDESLRKRLPEIDIKSRFSGEYQF